MKEYTTKSGFKFELGTIVFYKRASFRVTGLKRNKLGQVIAELNYDVLAPAEEVEQIYINPYKLLKIEKEIKEGKE